MNKHNGQINGPRCLFQRVERGDIAINSHFIIAHIRSFHAIASPEEVIQLCIAQCYHYISSLLDFI